MCEWMKFIFAILEVLGVTIEKEQKGYLGQI